MSAGERNRIRMTIQAILGIASSSIVGTTAFAQEQAQAQPQERSELEEIVVTGFRESLNAALDVKRTTVGSVDAIVAEDIADFPDLNLAESLQRIPGVSIARDAGEGRSITVRGLSPEFTRVRLNGMEAMSNNGGTDAAGGTNRGRGFDFNTFASELFNSITIRKTAAAEVEEGSLGATVDLRTGRPFDYDGFTVVTSATAQYNDLSEEIDPRGAFVISNTFADGRFGALLSVAYTERNLVDEGSSTVRWGLPSGAMTAAPGFTGDIAAVNAAFMPRIPRYDYYEHNQDRLGVTASLQFAPTDRTAINLDVLYAEFNAERSEIFLEVPNFSGGAQGMRVADAVIDDTNTVVYGVFNNVDIRAEQRFDELTTEFTQVTLDFSQELTDTLTLGGMFGTSESDHDNPVQTTLLLDWNNIPSMSYDFRGNSRLPVIAYGGTNLTSTTNGTPQTGATSTTNSNGWYLSQIRLRPQTALNEFDNYQVDLTWGATDSLEFKVGAQRKEFKFETSDQRIDPAYCTPPGAPTANAETCAATPFQSVPLSDYTNVFTYGNDLGIPSGTNMSFLLPDMSTATELFGLNDIPLSPTPSLGNNRRVEEEDTGFFFQAQLATEVASMPLRGNLGVRYVKTDQTSWGYTFLSGAAVLVEAERDYTDTLPSLNLALDVTDEFVVRASAAKVMSRPGLGVLTPGGTVTVSGNNRTANLGNPNIEPTRAKAYDMSFEWYFAPESLLSLALFYKDIESRATGSTLSDVPFTGNPFGIPDSVAIAACGAQPNCAPELANWTFNTTVNGPGGDLKGFEISYQQPFTFLPSFLSNFGVVLNYTGVESEIEYADGLKEDLVGLSNSAYNATLYYETERFGARVSAAYRDEFLTTVPGRNGNDVEGTAEVTTVDASARYSLTDSIDLTLEGVNLTDEFEDQWVDSVGNRLSYYHHTGRSYLFGARIKF
jgi:iron complex outermembrane recepter protein